MIMRRDSRAHVLAIDNLENIMRHLPPPSPAALISYRQLMADAGVPVALKDLIASEHTSQPAFDKASAFLAEHFPDLTSA